jgi:uncharacterized protein
VRVAVVSDTHDRLPEHVCEAIRDADEIWHLGDVCSLRVLAQLERITLLRVVRGNCDNEPDWPLTLDFTMEGLRIHMEHIPTTQPPSCDLFLHGHTHVPRDETIRNVRFLNPGCITRPNRGAPPSYAWLSLENGKVTWEIVRIA